MTNHLPTLIILFSFIYHTHSHTHSHTHQTNYDINSTQAWIYGFAAGTGLSLLGLVAAVLIVGLQKVVSETKFKTFINLLYALGCGAMIGDAMIHILPDSYKNEEANSGIVALVFITAITVFLGIQRLFVICGVQHQHWGDDQHQHHHSHEQHQHNHGIAIQELSHKTGKTQQVQKVLQNEVEDSIDNPEKKQEKQGLLQGYKGKGTSGYLNIISSFIHNFFDGLALGAAFASRQSNQYIPTVIAIYAHQIPRQMGDVGILLKNKFNNKQTILCNVVVNFTSLIGVAIGLALGSLNEVAKVYILSFVAGNFIYIGADIWRNLLKNKGCISNLLELCSFAIGVGSMYLVLLAQNQN